MSEGEQMMDFDEWIRYGIEQGWAGPPVCATHDGTPYSDEEEDQFEAGEDPCFHIVRLYEDAEQKASVEGNHAPSVWRNTWTNPKPDTPIEDEAPWRAVCCCGQPERSGVHMYPAGGPVGCKVDES